jgi:hypothetical protein
MSLYGSPRVANRTFIEGKEIKHTKNYSTTPSFYSLSLTLSLSLDEFSGSGVRVGSPFQCTIHLAQRSRP